MTKRRKPTRLERILEESRVRECRICRCMFDPELEGGTEGYIGIISVAFCPTCTSGIFDLVEQSCERCQGIGE